MMHDHEAKISDPSSRIDDARLRHGVCITNFRVSPTVELYTEKQCIDMYDDVSIACTCCGRKSGSWIGSDAIDRDASGCGSGDRGFD